MFVLPSQLESIARRIVFCHCEARRAEAISPAHVGGWLGPGLAPRTRPGDPTSDSRSGDRPELARMFRSGRSGASQRWIGVNRPGSDTGAETPPPLVGWVPRPAFDAALGSDPAPSSLNSQS